ncbi:MAG TPA: ABC transporter, partial [Sutterella wadsworthensis]|nr:ABC transporter [Sutterella wadsworthensis]
DLSGGERQRVWISMLLAQASPVMILDEPTSALDVRHQYGTLALLERLNRETGRGVIAIIHDINLALRFATHIVALKDGKVLFSGGAELLHSEENLRTLFEAPVKLMLHPDPPVAYTGGKKQLPLDVAVVCE